MDSGLRRNDGRFPPSLTRCCRREERQRRGELVAHVRQFAAFVRKDIAEWAKVVKTSWAKAE
jgi:hypothetical protein